MDDDQYGLPDLRQLISRSSHLSPISHPLEPYGSRTNPTHFDSIHVVPHHQYIPPPPTTHTSFAAAASSNPGTSLCAMDMDCGIIDSGNTRWPRQETLTLLEIRSQLDSKFKEANHKGPLWDEVSRIMSEEHGYQRSGKKCREKFENLYKYYKKTKEGKAGRQDGKNYRFFRQLEAIYGESAASVSTHYHPQEAANSSLQDQAKLCESLSFSISNSSHEFETSSSENNNDEYDLSAVAFMMSQSRDKKKQHLDDDESPINKGCKRSRRLRWREKVKSFVDSQMKKLMERQEAWMDNMLKTIELKEQERVWREMEWKKQETARFDREHELWAKERAWIEARDATLMEALKKFTGQDLINANRSLTKAQMGARYHQVDEPNMNMVETANESEILSLIQLRTGLESSFQDCGYSSDSLWEVIATKMACLGHNLSASECKEKWENIRSSFIKITECSRKD